MTGRRSDADRLHSEGVDAVKRGECDAAIALFSQAIALAPDWLPALYDRANTYLLSKKNDAALRDYETVMRLAPRGFCAAALGVDLLRREASGEFPSGLLAAILVTERMPPERRRDIFAQMLDRFPSCAIVWSRHADFVDDPVKRLHILEKGLAARSDIDTTGELLLKKVVTLRELGRWPEAQKVLLQLLNDPAAALGAQAKARFLQSSPNSRDPDLPAS